MGWKDVDVLSFLHRKPAASSAGSGGRCRHTFPNWRARPAAVALGGELIAFGDGKPSFPKLCRRMVRLGAAACWRRAGRGDHSPLAARRMSDGVRARRAVVGVSMRPALGTNRRLGEPCVDIWESFESGERSLVGDLLCGL